MGDILVTQRAKVDTFDVSIDALFWLDFSGFAFVLFSLIIPGVQHGVRSVVASARLLQSSFYMYNYVYRIQCIQIHSASRVSVSHHLCLPRVLCPSWLSTRQTVQRSYGVRNGFEGFVTLSALAKDVLCLPTFYLPSCLPSCLTSRLSLDDTACLPAGLCPLFPWHEQHERLKLIIDMKSTAVITSSTAQGGGGSFKNRKPIGRVGCCDSRMAERIHWWTERWLELCFFAIVAVVTSLTTPGWPHSQLLDVVWCSAVVVAVVVFVVVLMLLKL